MISPVAYPDPGTHEDPWTLEGSEGLTLFGKTTQPNGDARAAVIVVHGYTGHLDRNVVPLVAHQLASLGCLVHRFNLGHCGIEPGADRITRLDLFERDSLRHTVGDIRAVAQAVHEGDLPGAGLPLVLVGHSRAGAGVLGAMAHAIRDRWPIRPAGVITLASIGRYARTTPELLAKIERDGFIEREAARTEGGVLRLGRSWYEHELDSPSGDPFPADMTTLLDTPIALIHGEADTSVPSSDSQRIHDLLTKAGNSRCTLELVPGADHNFSAKGVLGKDLRWDRSIGAGLRAAVERGLGRILGAG